MVGLPAVGKTVRAKKIEESVGALRLTPDEWMLPLFGELEDEPRRDVVEGRLIWLAVRALRLGTNVILDFGVWSRAERSGLRDVAHGAGARFELVYVEVDGGTQKRQRDLRESESPQTTVPLSDDVLASYRTRFEVPGDDELDGTTDDAPPGGFATWSAWVARRWPTAIEDMSARPKP
jgi:predicted kinase